MALQDEDIYGDWPSPADEIQNRGHPQTIACMQKLFKSHNWRKRVLAVYVMGQLSHYKNRDDIGTHSRYGVKASEQMLVEALNDQHPDVIAIALSGLRHTPVPEALPVMLTFVNHPDKWCRRELAFALCGYENDGPHMTAVLLQLAADEYEITRDWATTALQWSHVDTPEVRERLWLNAHDTDPYVVNEALQGLARRKDPRTVEWVLHYIQNGGYCSDSDLLEVANLYDDPDLWEVVGEYLNQSTA